MIEKVQFNYTEDIARVISRPQFEAHINLYEGYVNNINKIDNILYNNPPREDANTTFSYYRELKRGETFALNGVILHELYFENLGGRKKEPSSQTKEFIEKDFGSYKNWKDDFVATAKASRGWAVLAYDQRSYRMRNISLDAHDVGNIAYYAPLLILDMYEHAYFHDYLDKKGEYIDKFMENIDWDVVDERVAALYGE